MNNITVVDIFCGAGGFSEGFRQQGFEILLGIDNWEPAIKTFNYNFGLNCKQKNVLDFEKSTQDIEDLPDSDIIIGSPPCVTFSNSNRSGKADKSSGISLTEILLRIIAVKKFKTNSKLKAWVMENVKNSVHYLKAFYTFQDLNLSEWALNNNLAPDKIAINIKDNFRIINSADYGSAQIRKRAITSEFIKTGCLINPLHTNQDKKKEGNLPLYKTLSGIKKGLLSPTTKKKHQIIQDPQYPDLHLDIFELTDHFYDSGLYECEWKQSQYLKLNHPYMGRMSFPENEERPSRTVTATRIGTSREALIYKSEYLRKGDGEYRIPTVRESACIMGFPITYQFIGKESAKYRLVGNAVCPSVSRAFAKEIKRLCGLQVYKKLTLNKSINLMDINNLNTFQPKSFLKNPIKNKGARFRRHAFKDGNMTVTLSNYDISKESTVKKWYTSIQYGNGEGFPHYNLPDGFYKRLEPIIRRCKHGEAFLNIVGNGFVNKIANNELLQEMYEHRESNNGKLEPTKLVDEVGIIIRKIIIEPEEIGKINLKFFKNKKNIPVQQLLATYAINMITTIANGN